MKSARVRVLLVLILGFSATVIAIWVLQKRFGYGANQADLITPQLQESAPSSISEAPSPIPAPGSPAPVEPTPTEDFQPPASSAPSPEPTPALTLDPSYVGRLNLLLPVVGVRADQLLDTFKDARSEDRAHDALDIPAPAGTPVVAVAGGQIIRLFQSELGGITIYQASEDRKLVFYYAHLQRYADRLVVEKYVKRGEIIGFVGDTGNAGSGNYHLHFSIMIVNDPKRYWEGTNINPYPLLQNSP